MGVQNWSTRMIQSLMWGYHWASGGVISFSLSPPFQQDYISPLFSLFSLTCESLSLFSFFWLYIFARKIYIDTCISFQSSSRWIHLLQQKKKLIESISLLYTQVNAHHCGGQGMLLIEGKTNLFALISSHFILIIFFHSPRVSDLATNVLSFFIVIP